MTRSEAVNWLINITADIGKAEHSELWHYEQALSEIREILESEPERKTGKWQWLSSTYDRSPCELRYRCSECHHETIFHSNQTSKPWEKFCPNCGADMRQIGGQDGKR